MIETVFQWFQNFFTSYYVQFMLNNFQWVDWFALLFFVLGVIYGIQNGFMSEVMEIVQIMIVIYFVLEYYTNLQSLVRNAIPQLPAESLKGFCFIAMALFVWGIAGLLYKFLRKFFHTTMAKPLRYIGGATLGGIHLLVIFSFLCQGILLLPFRGLHKAFDPGSSYAGTYMKDLAPKIHDMIAEPIRMIHPEDQNG